MGDKRRNVRLSVDIPVKIRCNGISHPGKSRNLSCGGMFVQIPDELPSKNGCDVVVDLPDGKSPLVLPSKVIWHKPKADKKENAESQDPQAESQAGLQFQTLDPEQKARLNDFIRKTLREDLH